MTSEKIRAAAPARAYGPGRLQYANYSAPEYGGNPSPLRPIGSYIMPPPCAQIDGDGVEHRFAAALIALWAESE